MVTSKDKFLFFFLLLENEVEGDGGRKTVPMYRPSYI
jgi:hypothetical protein